MKVKTLIEELENYDGDMEVVMGSTNSMYVNSILNARKKELRSFWGKDRDVLVLVAEDQVGAVWWMIYG